MSDLTPRPPVCDQGKGNGLVGRWRNLWCRLTEKWSASPETEALREAVEELMEAEPEKGAPTAEQTLLANVVNLRTRDVGDCMIPCADIKAVDINSSLKDLMNLVAACKHSRIPVYRDTLDDVLGMVHMKDVLLKMVAKEDCIIRDLLRPVLIVVPSMPASKLLLQMRQTRQHMAMVVDEFGGVDGLVTIEDLVEEIVGEIEDEHDAPETPDIIARTDGSFLINTRVSVDLFEERVGALLLSPEEREEIDTLAGFILHVVGRVPKMGESVKCRAGFSFEILEADATRIRRVRVRRSA